MGNNISDPGIFRDKTPNKNALIASDFFFPVWKDNALLCSDVICKLTEFTEWRMLRLGRFSLRWWLLFGRSNMRTLSARRGAARCVRPFRKRALRFVFSSPWESGKAKPNVRVYIPLLPSSRITRKDNEERQHATGSSVCTRDIRQREFLSSIGIKGKGTLLVFCPTKWSWFSTVKWQWGKRIASFRETFPLRRGGGAIR